MVGVTRFQRVFLAARRSLRRCGSLCSARASSAICGLPDAAGDALLVALARRLCVLLRPADTLARLHGDEFVVLCQDLHHPGEAQLIARRLELAVTEPFDLPGGRVAITASVGVAFADPSIHAPDEVMGNADTAMYQAKRARRAVH